MTVFLFLSSFEFSSSLSPISADSVQLLMQTKKRRHSSASYADHASARSFNKRNQNYFQENGWTTADEGDVTREGNLKMFADNAAHPSAPCETSFFLFGFCRKRQYNEGGVQSTGNSAELHTKIIPNWYFRIFQI